MKLHRYQRVLLQIALTGVWTLAACDSSEPAPAPSSPNAAPAERKTGDVEEAREGDEDDGDATLTFNYGGANVGDSATKDDVKKCHESGKFFDRFDGETGTCSKVSVARVDCTVKGIKAVLSTKQRKQFEDAIAGSYKGWKLDQCADCESGKDPLCQTNDGDEQTGTKLFFVKEENSELRGKALLMPFRPGQGKSDD